ncbi:Response regulator receiver domain-containing protein [Aliiroseovarius sediminilitoris]|uniref:Response regulator receiver domain-containing protein n=1 Tax=Aliiroseovarius sediminilitoris TaxID=1173584 RepID=A0A1I0MKR0_9RHOB|nr:response regulator [Aliiroseovarius sediminilitoris]SEV88450.1 Response regulator receiver domain-containing protein [Aliiroseovarius sediminilitoris]
MRVLIVETNPELAKLWASHLLRQGIEVECAHDPDGVTHLLDHQSFDVVVLNATFAGGNSIAIADYVAFRLPTARVVFVTASTFFSDGSIFNHITNVHACVSADIPSEDLANVIAFHGAVDNG